MNDRTKDPSPYRRLADMQLLKGKDVTITMMELRDHACSQCMPEGGPLVQVGFVCAYHLACEYDRSAVSAELCHAGHNCPVCPVCFPEKAT